jgi:hypothetical protein
MLQVMERSGTIKPLVWITPDLYDSLVILILKDLRRAAILSINCWDGHKKSPVVVSTSLALSDGNEGVIPCTGQNITTYLIKDDTMSCPRGSMILITKLVMD